jgi:hypothetical protein
MAETVHGPLNHNLTAIVQWATARHAGQVPRSLFDENWVTQSRRNTFSSDL